MIVCKGSPLEQDKKKANEKLADTCKTAITCTTELVLVSLKFIKMKRLITVYTGNTVINCRACWRWGRALDL